tara:strand:- start:313 stop:477 length:165 start_codon:yes stop_codon:yes gene_type:complete
MASVIGAFVGAFLGAFWAFKDERPAFGVIIFALLGFALFYAIGLAVETRALGGL